MTTTQYRLHRSGEDFFLIDTRRGLTLSPRVNHQRLRPDLFQRMNTWLRLDRVTNAWLEWPESAELIGRESDNLTSEANENFLALVQEYWEKQREAARRELTWQDTVEAASKHGVAWHFIARLEFGVVKTHQVDLRKLKTRETIGAGHPELVLGIFSARLDSNPFVSGQKSFFFDAAPGVAEDQAEALLRELERRFISARASQGRQLALKLEKGVCVF